MKIKLHVVKQDGFLQALKNFCMAYLNFFTTVNKDHSRSVSRKSTFYDNQEIDYEYMMGTVNTIEN